MSMHADDLRSTGGYLGELAAAEIEGLEQEVADSNKAYALLFAENAKLRNVHDNLMWIAETLAKFDESEGLSPIALGLLIDKAKSAIKDAK